MTKIALMGTCNGSNWRDKLIPILEKNEIDYFNPVVPEWNDEAYQRELHEREYCDYCLYVITPKMTGFYSIAEVIDDSNKRPEKTIYIFLHEDDGELFTVHQIKSLGAVGKMVLTNGGNWYHGFDDLVNFIK